MFTSSAPASNRSGEGASAVVTKLMMKGRSTACGMWSSDQAMKLASHGHGGSINSKFCRCGGTKRSSGPSARSPLRMRAPSATASFWPSPVAVGLTPEAFASCAPMYCAFSSGSLVKSPAASTTPPRAANICRPRGVSQSTAVTRPPSVMSARARACVTTATPARRAALSRWRMKARELGSTLCMRGFRCGGSGIGPVKRMPWPSSQRKVSGISSASMRRRPGLSRLSSAPLNAAMSRQ